MPWYHAEYLNGFWRDTLTIIGGVGFLLSAIGVLLGAARLRRTAKAAEAATEATKEAFAKLSEEYYRHVIDRADRLLRSACQHVRESQWELVGLRLDDLADCIILFARVDEGWRRLRMDVLSMKGSFERVGRKETTFSRGQRGKWDKLVERLTDSIASRTMPFQLNPEEG